MAEVSIDVALVLDKELFDYVGSDTNISSVFKAYDDGEGFLVFIGEVSNKPGMLNVFTSKLSFA